MPYLLQQLLTNSAGRHPSNEAVVDKEATLTYRELDEFSNQLAYTLRENGVEKGDRVGIYLNKSIKSVIAIFGVLKAGASYVPMDPTAPARRSAFIIGNCGIKALVSSQQKIANLRQVLPDLSPVQCLVFTDDGAPLEQETPPEVRAVSWAEVSRMPPCLPPPNGLIENDLAYILYTSGSTGEPKGVAITHRSSLTFVDWAHECFDVRATDRLSNHAPLNFDLSIFDIFAGFKAGATVVLVPEEFSVFPMNLADFIEKQRITIWYSVPSVLTRLVLYGGLDRHQFSNLRTILFAGEVFPIKYLRDLKDLIPHAEYYNLYGPTETNVCTYYEAGDISPERVEPLPIGKACPNTQVFALTTEDEIAGPDEVGELCVRGPSLMNGYWGLPERTEESLVPDPVHPFLHGEKMYRTGDLVKQDGDGNYLFLGRRDNMIKSRGYRIELGEIETVLYGHPQVQEVAVVAIPDEQIGNAIKAVLVIRNVKEVTIRELKDFCSEYVPKYMIPGIFEFCTELPKTSTGKVDKTLLVKEHLKVRAA